MSDKYSPYSIFTSKGKETEITPKEGLAPGMIGGPFGFDGAERYQYNGDEAAIIDGCSNIGAFFKVVVPLAKGGIAASALFVFILNC